MLIDKLTALITESLTKLQYPTDNINVIESNRKDLCDYQYDGAFRLAKTLHTSPLQIGENIIANLPENNLLSKCECLAPGFINFTLSNEAINTEIRYMCDTPKYGLQLTEPKTMVIDYGGPNIAKPLHVGHLRSAIVGESIKRILKYYNNKVISDVHFGDIGLQIGQVIYGLKQENISPQDINLSILERIYPTISGICKEDENIKEQCASITKALQDGNEEYRTYWTKICEVSSNDIKNLYKFIDVDFDYWYGESDAYKYIPQLTAYLEKQNLLKLSEGALIIDANLTPETNLPPLLYQKSNQAYLYGTTDLATIYQRMQDFHPDNIIYLTDSRQSLHFEQVFNVCQKSGLTPHTKLEHLTFGTVNGSDGKPYKTRSGQAPKLTDLFNEVKETFKNIKETNQELSPNDIDIISNAIIKFADLQNNREKDYIFDIAKFSEVIGKTGPYILYTYLRFNKILQENALKPSKLTDNIYNEVDRNLRLHIIKLANYLNNAYTYRSPSYIANYLYDLCVLLNTFYQTNHINNLEDLNNKEDWLYILKLSNNIIKDMLDLLVIKIPSKM